MNSQFTGVAVADPNLTGGAWGIDGVPVTPAAASFNSLTDNVLSTTMTSTPASGSCAVQFIFKNRAGTAIASPRLLHWYICDVNGVPTTAVTSVVTLTNGVIVTTKTGAVGIAYVTSTGLLGMTLTMTTGTYYVAFVLAEQRVIVSGAIVTS